MCKNIFIFRNNFNTFFQFDYLILFFLDMILIKMDILQKKMSDSFYLIFQLLIPLQKHAFKRVASQSREEESK